MKGKHKDRRLLLQMVVLAIFTVAILWLTEARRQPGVSENAAYGAESTGESAAYSAVPGGEADEPDSVWELADRPPVYTGRPFIRLRNDEPFFSEDERKAAADNPEAGAAGSALLLSAGVPVFQPLDERGRCGPALMAVGAETMAAGEREPISEIQPSGWMQAEYEGIDGGYLYHRCHLIGYQLCGISADERNLITGTRYLNITGMQPWEDWVAEYVSRTGRHVLYRVTPVFEGQNAVASGVLLEAEGVEDDTFRFCVFCYNVQPGIRIDYRTGVSAEENSVSGMADGSVYAAADENAPVYILNTNSGKFHRPDCDAAQEIAWRNRIEWIRGREDLCELGYSPCGSCRP